MMMVKLVYPSGMLLCYHTPTDSRRRVPTENIFFPALLVENNEQKC
jgi:hypothetical protein